MRDERCEDIWSHASQIIVVWSQTRVAKWSLERRKHVSPVVSHRPTMSCSDDRSGGEQLGIKVLPRIDEVALALVVDTWSRTYRSRT